MKISGKHFLLVLVIVFIISSCGRVNENHAEPTANPTATPTVEKTSTIQEPTQEPTPVMTETLKVDNRIVSEKCIEGIASLGEDENISGRIVLYIHESPSIYHNLLLFDTETQEITEISPPYSEENEILLSDTAVSPDGSYLAYQTRYFVGEGENWERIGNKIKIVNGENEKISEVGNLYTSTSFMWLNNEVLIIPTAKNKKPLLLTEIASGHQKYLYPILGNEFYDSDYFTWWFYYGTHKNIYNSDLSRVVYPDHEEHGTPVVIMHDLENNADILTIQTIVRYGFSPTWSPDGNYFAIAIADDRDRTEEFIYIFNRDGEIVFQTDASTTEMKEFIYSMAWSPDSKHLGFVYILEEAGETDESSEYPRYLGIVDVEKEKIALYCSVDVYPYTLLNWSPDNQYLLYPSQLTDEDEMKSYVLNIETGQNYLVMDGYFPGGWMK